MSLPSLKSFGSEIVGRVAMSGLLGAILNEPAVRLEEQLVGRLRVSRIGDLET